ncbi:MAG: IS110 family transposase [Symploca sp. SIO2E6]|nr:IS110 family transposase [Symploca sp. SIO2E6]
MTKTKKQDKKNPPPKNPDEVRREASPETYPAPPAPSKGKVIGIDCHPDTFTVAVFKGTCLQDAEQLEVKLDISLKKLLEWIGQAGFDKRDLFLMEAGANSFELCRRLNAMGMRAVVLESAHVGKMAKQYADNDRLAAIRIAKVFLIGEAPCVWIPDEKTMERRQLLHAYQRAVDANTRATNALKGYLNQFTVRLGKRSAQMPKTHDWVLKQRDWSRLEKGILKGHFEEILFTAKQRKSYYREITREMSQETEMLKLLGLFGIGIINAFALLAVIGDINRFETPKRLVAYFGLNPGRRESGNGKLIKIGVGLRGRRDMRNLLIQAAQTVMRWGRATEIGKWGWKLFARKGYRNVAVAAVARKLATQVWHLLKGNKPELLESSKKREVKLGKLLTTLGKSLRVELGLPEKTAEGIKHLDQFITITLSQMKKT